MQNAKRELIEIISNIEHKMNQLARELYRTKDAGQIEDLEAAYDNYAVELARAKDELNSL